MRPAYLLDLPLTDYSAALTLQRKCVAARRDGALNHDLVIMIEHPPVFTLGRRGGHGNLRVSEALLNKRGIQIIAVERGGDITYHGPGQLVTYPIIDLNRCRLKVVELVNALEAAMIRTAQDWRVPAAGNLPERGAWVGRRKLGSLGITIRRGVSFHGLALNVATDLEPFTWINPCGLADCEMTSLARETGRTIDMGQVRAQMSNHLSDIFGVRWNVLTSESLAALVRSEEMSA